MPNIRHQEDETSYYVKSPRSGVGVVFYQHSTLYFLIGTGDPRQIRHQVGRGTKPAADLVISSILDRADHHMLKSDWQLKTVLWHTLIVGHEWQGRGWQVKFPGRCLSRLSSLTSEAAHSSG